MKFLRFVLSAILACTLLLSALTGCGSKDSAAFPFTKLTWESSLEDMYELEGKDGESYASVYNGTTYTYPNTYMDWEGTIKYMYDQDKKLMSVAWAYSSNADEELKKIYDTIQKQLVKIHGESSYHPNTATNYGDVWDLSSGQIVLSVMNTEEQKVLQYAYMNPSLNEEESGTK